MFSNVRIIAISIWVLNAKPSLISFLDRLSNLLNASSFLGFQSDTNYGANGHGLYGVGGPETFVKCLGITPNLGFFVNSGFFKGYGFSIENLLLECDNEHNRSMTEGYEADFNIVQYRIDYRIPF